MHSVIGITMSEERNNNGGYRHALGTCYTEAIRRCGATAVLLPATLDEAMLRRQLSMVDGVLLTGGGDVAPYLYDEEPEPNLGSVDSKRDQYELLLVNMAQRYLKPVLGICRGMQVINIACGGSVYQDLADAKTSCLQHCQIAACHEGTHSVKIVKDTALYGLLGDKILVNSFHHQAIKRIAAGFTVTALAADGIIEGIERKSPAPLMGVQWHPERMIDTDERMLSVFAALVKAAAGRL